jgi:hypothetical protein
MALGDKIAENTRKALIELEAQGKIDLKKLPLRIEGNLYQIKVEDGSEPGTIHITLTPFEKCPPVPDGPNLKDEDPLGFKK